MSISLLHFVGPIDVIIVIAGLVVRFWLNVVIAAHILFFGALCTLLCIQHRGVDIATAFCFLDIDDKGMPCTVIIPHVKDL